MPERIVDLHVHHYTDRYLAALDAAGSVETYRREADGRFVALWNGGVALTVPQPHPSIGQRLDMMDEVGISLQVLSVPSPSCYFADPAKAERLARLVNEELGDIVRDKPDRFDALGMVAMGDIDRSMSTTTHAVDEIGMKGVMLLTNVDGVPLDDARFEPYWQMADDRGLLVYLHPTVPVAGSSLADHALGIAVGFFADTNLALARLAYSGVFERYPRIRWVISHLGGTLPFMLPRLDNYWRQFPEASRRSPRPPSDYIRELVFDTAVTHEPAIRCACQTLGVDRLVFGSDFPHVHGGSGPFLAAVDATGAEGEERAALLAGRADALLAGHRV
ncbi:amidohydrolase family protein [Micromonospora sp. NPDC005113]